MKTKDKCDIALIKEYFFEILANSVEDNACKICIAAGSSQGSTQECLAPSSI